VSDFRRFRNDRQTMAVTVAWAVVTAADSGSQVDAPIRQEPETVRLLVRQPAVPAGHDHDPQWFCHGELHGLTDTKPYAPLHPSPQLCSAQRPAEEWRCRVPSSSGDRHPLAAQGELRDLRLRIKDEGTLMKSQAAGVLIIGGILALVACLDRRDGRRKNEPSEQKQRTTTQAHHPHPTEEEHRSHREAHWAQQILVERLAVALSAIALFAAIAGYISLRSQTIAAWEAVAEAQRATEEAHRYANTAADTEIRQLRAYITLQYANDWRGLKAGEKLQARFSVVDRGLTPANNSSLIGCIDIFPTVESGANIAPQCSRSSFPFSVWPSSLGTGPQKTWIEATRSFDDSEIKAITTEGSGRTAYGVGTITYYDIFTKLRHTNFCFLLDPTTVKRASDGTVTEFLWDECGFHNDFD
jgi:hypothetical protein